jgi:hypothetical protein
LDPFQCHRLSSTESFGAVSSCHSNSQTWRLNAST